MVVRLFLAELPSHPHCILCTFRDITKPLFAVRKGMPLDKEGACYLAVIVWFASLINDEDCISTTASSNTGSSKLGWCNIENAKEELWAIKFVAFTLNA